MMPTFPNSAIVQVPERLLLRQGSLRPIPLGVRYGLDVHPQFGPVLIDTGYGPRATRAAGRGAMLVLYGAVLRPHLIENELPLAALERLGYGAADIRRIVVTHFHPDHIAGLRDFPNALFVASGHAWNSIQRMSAMDRLRNAIFLDLLPPDFEARLLPVEACGAQPLPYELGTGRDIWGDGSCLAVDLPGHAIGHFGLVWPRLDPNLLYAVDATWLSEALDDRLPNGVANFIYSDKDAMEQSIALVRAFRQAGGRVTLSHDRIKA